MATTTRVRDFADTIVTHTGGPQVELNVFAPTGRTARVETTVQLSATEAEQLALQLIRKAVDARKAEVLA